MNDNNGDYYGDVLAEMDDAFANAPAPDGGVTEVPDGDYQVVVKEAFLATSQTSGNHLLKWKLKVIGPRHRGATLWRNNVIARDKMQWLKKDLAVARLNLESLSELETRVEELKGVVMDVRVQKNGDFLNVWLNRFVKVDPNADLSDAAQSGFASPVVNDVGATTPQAPIDEEGVPF
jgi:hypothetical protein